MSVIPSTKPAGILGMVINHLLALDIETRNAVTKYAGSVIAIELLNTSQTLYLQITPEGFALVESLDVKPDVTIRGTPGQLFAYLMALKNDEPATSGVIEITGNIALAQKLAGIVKELDPDWEEKLSTWLGDAPARHIGNAFRNTFRLATHVKNTLRENTGEYLHHESGLVAERDEVNQFVRAVDVLRNDVERLRLRLDRLQQQTGEN